MSMGGMRHVSAGPSSSGPGVVGTSRIQAPSKGRRASSAHNSRRGSLSGGSMSESGSGSGDMIIGLTEKEVEAKVSSGLGRIEVCELIELVFVDCECGGSCARET